MIEVANEFNRPGHFTTFAAFEWSNTPDGSHFHRVVVFRGPNYPDVPFSALDSRHPEDLRRYADAARTRGIDSLLIPHNSNLSNGLQFALTDSYGKPIDREFATTKARNETLVEVTQIKGTSETHPELSPTDEFAGFEILNHFAAGKPGELKGSYVRDGYLRGLALAEKLGVNPHHFGLVGSSDYHPPPVRRRRTTTRARSAAATIRSAMAREGAERRQPGDPRAGGGAVRERHHRRVGRAEHARGDLRRAETARGVCDERNAYPGALLRRLLRRGPRARREVGGAGLSRRRAHGE